MKTTQHTPTPYRIDATGKMLKIRSCEAAPRTIAVMDYQCPHLLTEAERIATAEFLVTACNAHYELIDVLCSIINGSVRISDKANDMLSEHDPKVIRARAIIGQLLLDAMKGDCDAAIQSAHAKE